LGSVQGFGDDNHFVDGDKCLGKFDVPFFLISMVLRDVGPIRDHQLICFATVDECVGIAQEVGMIFKHFFRSAHFGVVAATIQGEVDGVN
jgi:hypothetical protein